MIREWEDNKPQIHPSAFVHSSAEIIGKVKLGVNVSIWPNVVLRGDVEHIAIGDDSNVQDGTVVHTNYGYPTIVGKGNSVGHGVNLHGCRVGNFCIVGIGSIVLDGAIIGDEVIIGAGAVVTKNIPPYAIAVGIPAQVIKYRFSKEKIEFLLKEKWWDLPDNEIKKRIDFFIDCNSN